MFDIPPDYVPDHVWISTVIRSYHQNRTANYNEHNLGIEVEIPIKEDIRLLGGQYNNSMYKSTRYIGIDYVPWHPISDEFKIGFGIAVGTGYKEKLTAATFPILSYESKYHVGVNVIPGIIVNVIQLKIGF